MPSVALIGPDGAGKTTLTRRLEASRRFPCRYMYMGVDLSASNIRLPTSTLAAWLKRPQGRARREDERGPAPEAGGSERRHRFGRLRAAARLTNRLAEEWYRQLVSWYYQRRGFLVLYDRHFAFDFAPEISVEPTFEKRLHRWFLQHLYPHPQLVIFLDAPGAVLFARKGESTVEELERRRQGFLRQGQRLPNFVRVDATRPLEEVYQVVVEHVGRLVQGQPVGEAPGGAEDAGAFRQPVSRGRRTSAGSLRVLTYHRVMDPRDPGAGDPVLISATPESFDRQMRHLARHYRVVSADEALAAVRGERPLPARAVLLTFDDAYQDFAEFAWPVLRRYSLPSTLFVPTAYPDHPEREFWWDRLHRAFAAARGGSVAVTGLGTLPLAPAGACRQSLRRLQDHLKQVPPAEAMVLVERICHELGDPGGTGRVLGWEALRELSREGVTVAPHTRTHPALDQLSPEEARREIRISREEVQREIGSTAPVFAYPYGAYDDAVVEIARQEGFEIAVTCLDGHNRIGSSDPLRFRRTNITLRTSPTVFGARLLPAFTYVDRWRHRARAS